MAVLEINRGTEEIDQNHLTNHSKSEEEEDIIFPLVSDISYQNFFQLANRVNFLVIIKQHNT